MILHQFNGFAAMRKRCIVWQLSDARQKKVQNKCSNLSVLFFLHSAILWYQRYLTETVWEDGEGSVHENEFFRFGESAYAA